MKIDIRSLFNRARLAWIGLISKVKSVFSLSNGVSAYATTNRQNDIPNDQIEEAQDIEHDTAPGNLADEGDDVVSELDEEEEEVFYDAIETLDEGEIEDPKPNEVKQNNDELEDEQQDALEGLDSMKSLWSWITSKAQILFSLSNEEETQNIVVENVKNNRDNSDLEYPEQDEANAVGKAKKNMNAQARYADNHLLSTKNSLQAVDKITKKSTFAIVLYDHEIKERPDDNVDNYKLTDLQFIDGKCVSKLGQLGVEFVHIRLFMPFFFKNRIEMSVNDLFQYKDKNGVIHTPSVVILLDQSESINLALENLGRAASLVWSYVEASEIEKSTRITPTLFRTFTIGLSEEQGKQILNFVLKQAAVPDIMENLKKEKPTIRRILTIPLSKRFIMSWVNSILDAVMVAPKGTNGEKVANFHVRDVLMNGTMLNDLQKQTNGQEASSSQLNAQQIEKPDLQHARVEHANIEQVMEGRSVTKETLDL